ncbi:hypothetical protein PR048_017279 [Dryococelus australis]|uniref:Uncharacterized protein n=1 Tax=Dryococelus australis TaxID=614101 RepID=A0ABQ9H9P3_9NEOP|nr:hypothetical protein PR048_017279 [Dryococelus australis]
MGGEQANRSATMAPDMRICFISVVDAIPCVEFSAPLFSSHPPFPLLTSLCCLQADYRGSGQKSPNLSTRSNAETASRAVIADTYHSKEDEGQCWRCLRCDRMSRTSVSGLVVSHNMATSDMSHYKKNPTDRPLEEVVYGCDRSRCSGRHIRCPLPPLATKMVDILSWPPIVLHRHCAGMTEQGVVQCCGISEALNLSAAPTDSAILGKSQQQCAELGKDTFRHWLPRWAPSHSPTLRSAKTIITTAVSFPHASTEISAPVLPPGGLISRYNAEEAALNHLVLIQITHMTELALRAYCLPMSAECSTPSRHDTCTSSIGVVQTLYPLVRQVGPKL